MKMQGTKFASVLIVILLSVNLFSGYSDTTDADTKELVIDEVLLEKFSTLRWDERQLFLRQLYADKDKYVVDKDKISDRLIKLMRSAQVDNQTKCGLAYLAGVFKLEDCVDVLVENFMLWNQDAGGPDAHKLIGGEWPAQRALISLGETVFPKMVNFIENFTSTNKPPKGIISAYTTNYTTQVRMASAYVIHNTYDGYGGKEALQHAIEQQQDTEKRARLQEVLNMDIFKRPNPPRKKTTSPNIIKESEGKQRVQQQ